MHFAQPLIDWSPDARNMPLKHLSIMSSTLTIRHTLWRELWSTSLDSRGGVRALSGKVDVLAADWCHDGALL
jgi:hypothetical protein